MTPCSADASARSSSARAGDATSWTSWTPPSTPKGGCSSPIRTAACPTCAWGRTAVRRTATTAPTGWPVKSLGPGCSPVSILLDAGSRGARWRRLRGTVRPDDEADDPNDLSILLRHFLPRKRGGLEGLSPIGVDLDPHAEAISDCVLVGIVPLDRNAAFGSLGHHPHKDEHALIINVEEPLGFEVQGVTPRQRGHQSEPTVEPTNDW